MRLRSVGLALTLCAVGFAQSVVPAEEQSNRTKEPKRAPAAASQDEQLRKEEMDAQYLMDLQVREAENTARTSRVMRENQERQAAMMTRLYEGLLDGYNRQAVASGQPPMVGGAGGPGARSGFPDTSPGALLGGGAAVQLGMTPGAAGNPGGMAPIGGSDGKPVSRMGSESTRALDALAQEDGPEIARQKGLGFVPMGTIVDVRLLTAVNTAIPGPVVGIVIHDVFDVDMRLIVIPRGSKCIGQANSMGSDTEGRGRVVFNTFVDPSGRIIPIAIPVPSANRIGITGIDGHVNYHWARVFGGSAAVAVLSGLMGGQGASPYSTNASSGDIIRQNLMQAGGTLSQQLLQRFIQVRPDISLDEGSTCKLILMQHLMAKPYSQVW